MPCLARGCPRLAAYIATVGPGYRDYGVCGAHLGDCVAMLARTLPAGRHVAVRQVAPP